jgi:hypothetical protein
MTFSKTASSMRPLFETAEAMLEEVWKLGPDRLLVLSGFRVVATLTQESPGVWRGIADDHGHAPLEGRLIDAAGAILLGGIGIAFNSSFFRGADVRVNFGPAAQGVPLQFQDADEPMILEREILERDK